MVNGPESYANVGRVPLAVRIGELPDANAQPVTTLGTSAVIEQATASILQAS